MNTSYTAKDWSELTHAYGSAEDVPALLVDLNSADEQTRGDACSELFGNIWHQGTVYSATVKALPELITLFRLPDCRDRESVAILIASIADGNGFYHVHGQIDALRKNQERVLAERGTSMTQEIEKEADYLKVIRAMSLEILPELEPFLNAPNWCLREAIVGVFQRYAEHIPNAIARLEERLAVESHEDVRHRIETALAEMKQAQGG